MAIPTMTMAAQPTVNLGTASTFAVLAGESITNTGTTIINGDAGGDVGLYAGSSVTGWDSVTMSGALHISDAVAILAKTDLIYAYDDDAGRTPETLIPTELGGTTLTPGTYVSESGTFEITGTLTLDAQGDPDGVFIFKTTTTLITASNSNVNLIGDARYCRIFWKVGSSATLGTSSHFVGHIFALTSITADTGATVQGQLLARNGSVFLHNNTITNGICETTSSSGSTASSTSTTATSSSSTATSDNSTATSDNSTATSDSSTGTRDSSNPTISNTDSSSSNTATTNMVNPQTSDSIHMLMGLFALVTLSAVTAFIINKKSINK